MTLAEIDNLSSEEIQDRFDELQSKIEKLDSEAEFQKNEADKYKGYYEAVKSDLDVANNYNSQLIHSNGVLKAIINSIIEEL